VFGAPAGLQEDMINETIAHVLASPKPHYSNPKAYFTTALKNTVIQHHRGRRRRRLTISGETVSLLLESIESPWGNPETEVLKSADGVAAATDLMRRIAEVVTPAQLKAVKEEIRAPRETKGVTHRVDLWRAKKKIRALLEALHTDANETGQTSEAA
jgi:DNA-directed RNA polymerase specialized sigma24 family protein